MARQATGQAIERHGKQGITYAARVRAYGQRHYISLGYSWEGATRLKAAQPKRTWLEPEQVKPLLDATVCGLRGGKTKPTPRHARCSPPRSAPVCASASCWRCAGGRGQPRPGPPHRARLQDRGGRARDRHLARAARRARLSQGSGAPTQGRPTTCSPPRPAKPTPARTSPSASSAPSSAPTRRSPARRTSRRSPSRCPALAATHVRLAAVPTRREPRLRHAPDGPHRPQARPAHLHEGHGRTAPPGTRGAARQRARRGALDGGEHPGRDSG